MTAILSITFPIYAAILIGYMIVRKGWFTKSDMRILGKYVINLALPALLFNALATRDFADVFHIGYIVTFAVGGLATIALTFAWFTFTGVDKARRAVAVMGSTCPNSGFIGFPIMLLVLPDVAGVILALNLLVENLLLLLTCLVLVDLAKDDIGRYSFRSVGRILWNVLTSPLLIGLMLGLVASVLQIPMPAAGTRLFTMIAASASALSLIVIGGSLVGLPMTGNKGRALQIATGKLLVHPVLVALTAAALPLIGMNSLPHDLHVAAILSAAMPMLSIYAVLAQKVGLEGLASITTLITTFLGFFTLSGLLLFLT